MLLDTSKSASLDIYIQASTGDSLQVNATSPLDSPTVVLEIVKRPRDPPFFFGELDSQILLDLNLLDETSIVTFLFPEVLSMSVWAVVWISVDNLPSFATYSNETLESSQLQFTGLTEELKGVYTIKINVTDDELASTEYEIKIEVAKPYVFAGIDIQ